MVEMFQGCKELEYLDLSNFNTTNVNNMSGMFRNCYKLKEIKGLDNFNTSNVKTMNLMFQSCKELVYCNYLNSYERIYFLLFRI